MQSSPNSCQSMRKLCHSASRSPCCRHHFEKYLDLGTRIETSPPPHPSPISGRQFHALTPEILRSQSCVIMLQKLYNIVRILCRYGFADPCHGKSYERCCALQAQHQQSQIWPMNFVASVSLWQASATRPARRPSSAKAARPEPAEMETAEQT